MIPGVTASTTYVYETEPVTSDLDIFFETSTGGLIADLPDNNIVEIDFTNCIRRQIADQRIELNRIRADLMSHSSI